MPHLKRSAPPTAKQTAAMQALMVHRSYAAAARSLGVAPKVLREAVLGFVRRAR